jgi:hypothetical protein
MRYAARLDKNHNEIKQILERYFTVRDCSNCPGLGADLIIEQRRVKGMFPDAMFMIEIKDGPKKTLTASEQWNADHFKNWRRINSVDEAIAFCRVWA